MAELPTALIDFPGDGPDAPRRRLRFERPQRWLVAHDPAQVAALLDDAHEAARQGQWCVGWVAYEAAPAFDPHLPVKALPPGAPYAVWAVFDQAQPWPEAPSPQAAPWQVGPWASAWSEPQLHQRIQAIRELIRQGEVYQINLTSPLKAPFEAGPPTEAPELPDTPQLLAYFAALQRSQSGGYAAFLDSRAACRGPGAVLSVSPELFFDWRAPDITTRPMKGTAARHASPEQDQAAKTHLHSSAKERAENLMIVDLLRNDLSKIAALGSVSVPSMFDVQALSTVWQMTSTVTARTRAGLRLSEVMGALFPCGSVTGAPKRQAMHHIARLESEHRGVYCGAMGLMAPGGRVTLNVPIRTVCIDTPPPLAPWRARCGIGSGITLDATPEGEALEWQHKRAFLHRADEPFELLESLRLDEGEIPRLALHLARLARSAQHFGFPWSDAHSSDIQSLLAQTAQANPQGVFKLRLLLDARGQAQVQCAPLPPMPTPIRIALAQQAMPQADDFIRHKTTRRQCYAPFAPPPGCFDTLLYNAQGELTEFTIGNVALHLGDQWFTPPLSAGLLPGVMRQSLLDQSVLTERTLMLDDLSHARGMVLINSVRGWLEVDTIPAYTPNRNPS
jgi:para-aminobenzoate synthetase/4-amino-4-deoxychorismate lyase